MVAIIVARPDAGLLWLVGAGDQGGERVNEETVHAAVAGVVDPADVCELVAAGFDQRSLSRH